MTHERDFDRIARAWLAAGPDEAPDRAVAAVLAAIETTPQVRRPWRWPLWRQFHMTPRAFALVGALVMALLVASSITLRSPHEIARPTRSPSAVPTEIYQSLIDVWAGAPRALAGAPASAIVRATFREGGRLDVSGETISPLGVQSNVEIVNSDRLKLTTFTKNSRCDEGSVGTYQFLLSPAKKRLRLTPVSDPCADRAVAVEGDWVRTECTTGPGLAGGDWDCYGDLEAGTYKSRAVNLRFDISQGDIAPITYGALTFTVPGGWSHVADNATRFWLMPSDQYPRVHDGVPLDGLFVFGHPQAASQADGCPFEPQPGVGLTPSDLTSFITSLPGIRTSNLQDVTINGRSGARVDIQLDPSWRKTCPWHGEAPMEPFLYVNTGVDGADVTTRLRMIFLDIGHGDTVAVEIAAADPARWDDYVAGAMPIVESFVFAEP
jgi:hypothetical protein